LTEGTLVVDKDASTRFIKNAITQATTQQASAQASSTGPTHLRFNETMERLPVKVTSKMREREHYEKDLKEADTDETEEDLEVFEEEIASWPSPAVSDKGKEKATVHLVESAPEATKKRRRPAVDVFGGASPLERDGSRGLLVLA
jgi:exosome complex protein LRP1